MRPPLWLGPSRYLWTRTGWLCRLPDWPGLHCVGLLISVMWGTCFHLIIEEWNAVQQAQDSHQGTSRYCCTGRNLSCDKPATTLWATEPSSDTGRRAILRFEPPTRTRPCTDSDADVTGSPDVFSRQCAIWHSACWTKDRPSELAAFANTKV
jgi:hypothetical protein